jgi:hypothetical protein
VPKNTFPLLSTLAISSIIAIPFLVKIPAQNTYQTILILITIISINQLIIMIILSLLSYLSNLPKQTT